MDALPDKLHDRLHQAGFRVTTATKAVLALLSTDSTWAPSHAEVLARLEQTGLHLNRVTLYRLLDRLALSGILDRHIDPTERLWRFSWAWPEQRHELHPRFECDACHRQLALDSAQAAASEVAQSLRDTLAAMGHQAQRLDLTVHGTCAGCATPDT